MMMRWSCSFLHANVLSCTYVQLNFSAVTSILVVFVNMFKKSREENQRNAEAEKKKMGKEALKEKSNAPAKQH